ncbi:hypothetical protein M0208_18295 [Sphingomonas sp. SUN019]|uniref:hypothetical protein n=1 Tax=Sphingomonas sp. SUN019 TaxID=2937788 RepID=UPI0021648218|nr:hypothetical protein [Sphingomonas sp. SUN019]UVO52363.1 hypothetical protein M0208_18295 [Sphingomonas sp. SUN019]
MFGNTKPLASLSSGLLARKGQARPAMRPQGFASLASLASAGEDLGWNDMGAAPVEAPVPPVLVEREALKEEIEAPTVALTVIEPEAAEPVADVSVRTAERLRRETKHKKKAAFTLRLDEELHLRLRLATATRGRSAQMLVTEALVGFIQTLPEVEALVSQLPPRKNQR